VAPIDGKEYAAHHRETKAEHAGSEMKKRNPLAVRDDHSWRNAQNGKIVEGQNHLIQSKHAFQHRAGTDP
jgi:hypothetical protein